MSDFDWDELQIINNPDLKEITVSFNGDGGLGAFGSNNSSGSGDDPGALPTLPPDDPESPDRPVLPAPEDNAGGITPPDAPPPGAVTPAETVEECLGHDCAAIEDYLTRTGATSNIGLGINPTYEGSSNPPAGVITYIDAFNNEFQPEFPSLVYIFTPPDIRNYPADNLQGLCDTDVLTWFWGAGGINIGTFGRYYDQPSPFPIANSPGNPASPNDGGFGQGTIGPIRDEVYFYVDTTMTGTLVHSPPDITMATPRLVTVSSNNIITPFGVGGAPQVSFDSVPDGSGFTFRADWNGFDPSAFDPPHPSGSTQKIGNHYVSWGAAHGWWKMEMFFTFTFVENVINGQTFFSITVGQGLIVTAPDGRRCFSRGGVYFSDAAKILGIDAISQVSGPEAPYFAMFGGSPFSPGCPRIIAVAKRLGGDALVVPRILRSYTPPSYCELIP